MTTYRRSGVDQDAADTLIPVYAELAAKTRTGGAPSGAGDFAGLLPLDEILKRGYARPALAASTDTVGTKIDLLRRAGHHRTAGWDCVAMNVDDVVCCGAEPLLFVDCIATERLDAVQAAEIVAGVADACIESGCELVGGETAQLPGLLTAGAYEVMGTCIGVVDLDAAWGPARVREGDAVVGIASSGLHSNGYSLVRKVLETADEQPWPELLEPTAIYARKLLDLGSRIEVHAAAHITGGGLAGNLARALPKDLGASVDLSAWERPETFARLAALGVDEDEIRATFNIGIGMVVITPDGAGAVDLLAKAGATSWVIGEVGAGPGVRLG